MASSRKRRSPQARGEKGSSNGTSRIRRVSGTRTSRFWPRGYKPRCSRPTIPVKGRLTAFPENDWLLQKATVIASGSHFGAALAEPSVCWTDACKLLVHLYTLLKGPDLRNRGLGVRVPPSALVLRLQTVVVRKSARGCTTEVQQLSAADPPPEVRHEALSGHCDQSPPSISSVTRRYRKRPQTIVANTIPKNG